MALNPSTAGELRQAFSLRTTIQLYRQSIWATLMNRGHEAELANARSTVIQNPAFATTVKSRSRGSKWGEGQEITSTPITLTLDQPYEVGPINWRYEDQRQAPMVGWLEQARQDAAAKTAIYMDDNLNSFVNATTPGESLTVGSGTTNAFTTKSGDGYPYYVGTGNQLVAQAIKELSLHWYDAHVGDDGISVGGMPGSLWALMDSRVFNALLIDMENRNLHFDTLTDSLFDNRLRANRAWRGRLYGIDIMVSTVMRAGTGKNVVMYSGTNMAVALAVDPPVTQFWTPETNQDGPNYKINMAGLFGRQLVNKDLLTKVTFATKKS